MILNSDPVLDLGEAARSAGLRLRSCLGAPLISEGQLVGVLTLYSEAANGFTEEDRRSVEAVALKVGDPFRRAVEVEVSAAPRAPAPKIQRKTEATGRYPSKAYR
jgi:GAF domain-containing protein